MKIEHTALYARDLEAMKDFFETWFGCISGELYHNPRTGFSSYFLRFDEGSRLEIMHWDDIDQDPGREHLGLVHLCLSVGSKREWMNWQKSCPMPDIPCPPVPEPRETAIMKPRSMAPNT